MFLAASPQGSIPSTVFAGLEHLVPELHCEFRIGINFKTVFAGVAGPRNDRFDTVNAAGREMVVLDLVKIRVGQVFQDADGLRSLDGDLAIIRACVGQRDILVLFVRRDPLPILLGCTGVYDEQ